MHPVFTQLLHQPTIIPPDLMRRIDEVWNKAIDGVGNFSNPDPDKYNDTVVRITDMYGKKSTLDEIISNYSRLFRSSDHNGKFEVIK